MHSTGRPILRVFHEGWAPLRFAPASTLAAAQLSPLATPARELFIRDSQTRYAPSMVRTYDIFEMIGANAIWQKAVTGHDDGIAFARAFAEKTTNEVRVIHLPSKSLIAQFNSHDSPATS